MPATATTPPSRAPITLTPATSLMPPGAALPVGRADPSVIMEVWVISPLTAWATVARPMLVEKEVTPPVVMVMTWVTVLVAVVHVHPAPQLPQGEPPRPPTPQPPGPPAQGEPFHSQPVTV